MDSAHVYAGILVIATLFLIGLIWLIGKVFKYMDDQDKDSMWKFK